ncbi:hypothetical protein PVAP13_6KG259100 [Panicum virgatum]|uniref:CBS domain-containing protein n=1 Tax=Panicum virgatum TaxID=38727 RepID=A0A8T0RDV0_PANVG|nr:hypothetical protein PVAP13_6KG259100 [Panicum virgatum]
MPEDFDKCGSGKQDTIADVQLSAEEMEMFVDLHPFTNTSPYTVVETMSLAKALVLFREVGLRHLLVVPKACDRSPVVGILTRHDFMPEHILGLHPVLLGSRWKRLRWQRAPWPSTSAPSSCGLPTVAEQYIYAGPCFCVLILYMLISLHMLYIYGEADSQQLLPMKSEA